MTIPMLRPSLANAWGQCRESETPDSKENELDDSRVDPLRRDLVAFGMIKPNKYILSAVNKALSSVLSNDLGVRFVQRVDCRSLVCLRPEGDANQWYVGVGLEAGTGDTDSAKALQERLRERTSPSWPWYRYLEEHGDWRPLLARLHKETQEPAELTAHFSSQFVETAERAIPIIDEVLAKR